MPDHGACVALVEAHRLGVAHQDTCASMEVTLLMKVWPQALHKILLYGEFLGSFIVIVAALTSLLNERTLVLLLFFMRELAGNCLTCSLVHVGG